MYETRDFPPEALAALVDSSAAINSAQDLDQTLAAIARAAAAVMKAEASSVIMLDRTRNKQVFRAAVGDRSQQLIGVEYPIGAGISGEVMEAGEARIVNDVSKVQSHYKAIDNRVGFDTRSIIIAPLINKGQVLGVVEVLNPIQAHTFDHEDLQLATLFANLAAISAANAQLYHRLDRENRGLKATGRDDDFIGISPAVREVKGLIRRVARSMATVLLLGETGTGKELAARMIHDNSDRCERSFIAVNCAALPEALLESELFGHEAGAFTGATSRKLGRFELADGGTIFLDEIGEIDRSTQVKLLRVLQEKEIVRVGGVETIACDVRILAATNRNLPEEMLAHRFREDLYYRLSVFPIEIPPLRHRVEDIPLLVEHFVRRLGGQFSQDPPEVSHEAMEALGRHSFPGNIRELQNILERACLLCCSMDERPGQRRVIRPEHLPRELISAPERPVAGGSALAQGERVMIVEALEDNGWNQSAAARALGISRDNIRYRIRKYGIERPG